MHAQEAEVLGRIEASFEDPLSLEAAGHALLDMYPERRGNIFSDEVYRLTKATDATTTFSPPGTSGGGGASPSPSARCLPPNHKFGSNDVIMLTLQPGGSGDFFDMSTLPTSRNAVTVEARVLSTGPTYIDVAVQGGSFAATFGPAPNNHAASQGGRGDRRMRLRADRYFSNIPYERMVAALGRITALPEKNENKNLQHAAVDENQQKGGKGKRKVAIPSMDDILRQAIVSTYDPHRGGEVDDIIADPRDRSDLSRKLAKPPLPNSVQLANQALTFMQSEKATQFPAFNEPQLTAIGAALSRRMTMIQGPPGTGKTLVAASIAFGFTHQCRNVSPHTKVLACAFSNIGADNLAEQLIRLGLKVVRVGKASGVSESLWDHTLDAAIYRDPNARKAQEEATKATANLPILSKGGGTQHKKSTRFHREAATTAVRTAIQASNIAATKSLREADVIVCTSVGAADTRLLSACGINADQGAGLQADGCSKSSTRAKPESACRDVAPDGLPPLSTPFVIVDEACQSLEPANLIPITATDSCRSLVMLGDPCQLPPTVRGDMIGTGSSPLSVSLMARLASSLQQPVIVTARSDKTRREDGYLNLLPTKQAVSLVRKRSRTHTHVSYRKQFAGSLLLSVQYRMHPSISAFSSAVFYDSLLSTPAFLAQNRIFPTALNKRLPSTNPSIGIRLINVGGRSNERKGIRRSFASAFSEPSHSLGESKSYRNVAEAKEIIILLKDLLNEHQGSDSVSSIGVITPYSSQVQLIKSLMSSDSEFLALATNAAVAIEVRSVDGYQGRERDLILFSTVRSNRNGRVGFLADWRRMNVALTRAKSGLVVVGDVETLREGDKHWEAFTNWCEGVDCITDASSSLALSSGASSSELREACKTGEGFD